MQEKKGAAKTFEWQDKALMKKYPISGPPRRGQLRANWKKQYKIDLDEAVHPKLFRILGRYVDQGLADWMFPVRGQGLLDSLREMESNSYVSVFRTSRARDLLVRTNPSITGLLGMIVGEETLFRQYLFDQQFAHLGWSALICEIEKGNALPGRRTASLHDVAVFELLLEIDELDYRTDGRWLPLSVMLAERPPALFDDVPATEKDEILEIWQEAVEWSCYDAVLTALNDENGRERAPAYLPGHEKSNAGPDTVCIIGGSWLAERVSTACRASLKTYDFATDPHGNTLEKLLGRVLSADAPASLGRFFSRTGLTGTDGFDIPTDDVIGLVATAGNAPGDLRIGLHSPAKADVLPVRLLCVVEQCPEIVLNVIVRSRAMHEWFANEWIHLVVVDPGSGELRILKNGKMTAYKQDRRATGRRLVENAVH